MKNKFFFLKRIHRDSFDKLKEIRRFAFDFIIIAGEGTVISDGSFIIIIIIVIKEN